MENKTETYINSCDAIDPRCAYGYGELKDFLELYWQKTVNRCLRKNDFSTLERHLTDDVEFVRSVPGIEPLYYGVPEVIKGKEAVIKAIQEEYLMGVPGWSYPPADFGYDNNSGVTSIIDIRKGVIIYKVQEITPYLKKDGTPFCNPQYDTFRLEYAGGYKVNRIVEIGELELRMRAMEEICAAGLAPQDIQDRVAKYHAQLHDFAEKWTAYIKNLYDKCDHPDKTDADRDRFFNYLDNDACWRR